MDDWLESEEFYNAMQGYRCAPTENQREVVAHFENVKRLIRKRIGSEREREVLAGERNHAKACYDRAVRILTGIHALLYPPRFTDNDGRTWQFKSPLAEEQMQELSDRIRALPDDIEAIVRAHVTTDNGHSDGQTASI